MSEKLSKLKSVLEELGSVVVAFSGGVDSTFLLKVAFDTLGNNVVAVTATSSTYPKRELDEAKKLASSIGVRHLVVESEELDISGFSENTKDRCYYCKKELFGKLLGLASENGVEHVIEASNTDDLNDYRPGMKAIKELGVKSPLVESGFSKVEIRAESMDLGLSTFDKPSFACLASRFPYGSKITKGKLSMIEKAEDYLTNLGVLQVRVRLHDKVARIEVFEEDFNKVLENKDEINKKLKAFGFAYIALDLKGYRTGSMNEVLGKGN